MCKRVIEDVEELCAIGLKELLRNDYDMSVDLLCSLDTMLDDMYENNAEEFFGGEIDFFTYAMFDNEIKEVARKYGL